MAIYQSDWHWFRAWGDITATIEVNIPPAWIGAQTNLQGAIVYTSGSNSRINFTGIHSYRRRLDNGQDEVVSFGATEWEPPAIFDHISSITFLIYSSDGGRAWLVARMDYWG